MPISAWRARPPLAGARLVLPTAQGLLEEDSTRTRLLREKDVLESTLKYYSAASALESVFREDKDAPGGAAPLPPPGGPD